VWIKHQPWVDQFTKKADFRPDIEWNIWSVRQTPFNDLISGEEIVYVSGGGPRAGRLMYTARADCLVAEEYLSHAHAWDLMKSALPKSVLRESEITRKSFLTSPYTLKAPASGWLLAWSGTPVRWLDLPRPTGMKFRPNGWSWLDDDHPSLTGK